MNGFFKNIIDAYSPLEFAMAYGSGVVKQEGYSRGDKPMIDMVFGVQSSSAWHKENLSRNPRDYSSVARAYGALFASFLQRTAARIYYHSHIQFEGQQIKYGVISEDDLKRDLLDWERLYVAGRLHKPVMILKSNESINSAIEKNLEHAINVSLLLLPERFSKEQLYTTITRISYFGDTRMLFGENPKKIQNIVQRNMQGFDELYHLLLASNKNIALSNGLFYQDKSPATLEILCDELPSGLRHKMPEITHFGDSSEIKIKVRNAISQINLTSSTLQTFKGLVTVGAFKSTKYFMAKIKKARKR